MTVLVHNSTETVSSSILLYVNLNSQHFQNNQLQPIVARLDSSSYYYETPAEIFFTQPDGTLNSTVDIVLNSSLELSYCHDQFQNMTHGLYSVPIVVIPHNVSFVPANHQHKIWLTHHYNKFDTSEDLIWSFGRESLDIFVNKTGTCI